MSQEEGSDEPAVVGRPVEEAVEAVLAEDDSRDRDAVRTALGTVAEDGVVSDTSVDSALGQLAKVISTPETRVEFAAMELSDARETATSEGVAELDTVRARLETYESRLEAVEEDIAALGPRLREVVDRRGTANAYETATAIRELETEANELHRAADELQVELEEFGRWLGDPTIRYDEFEEDLEAVEGSLDVLEETADDVATAASGDGAGDGAEAGSDVDPGDADTPAEPDVVWADATLRTRVTALLLADLRAELADLRAWPEAADEDDPARLDELDERLAGLEGRCQDLSNRLEELARPAWTERYGEPLDRFDDAAAGFVPPVDWGDVDAELERVRDELGTA